MFLYVYLYITVYYKEYEIRFQKIIRWVLIAYLFFSASQTSCLLKIGGNAEAERLGQ